jgi:hypothetical protein
MSKLLALPANTAGRDFVCGDIHGCFDELDAALAKLQFDPAVDRLISVGDLVDRGPRSADEPLVQFLLWQRQGALQQLSHSIAGVRHAFYGHNVVPQLMTLGNRSYIDLGCYATGQLAVIDIADWLSQH